MKAIHLLRSGLAAALLGGFATLSTAEAGVFTVTAFGDVQLLTEITDPDVTVTFSSAVTFEDAFASNPPLSFVDIDPLLITDPATGFLSNIVVAVGDALRITGAPAVVQASVLTEGFIEIDNASSADVELEFAYAYDLFVEVLAQSFGVSTAFGSARVELFTDVDVLVDELVFADLGVIDTDSLSGFGNFSVTVPAGGFLAIGLFVDAVGSATHIPVPATLPVLAAGLVLFGLARRRT